MNEIPEERGPVLVTCLSELPDPCRSWGDNRHALVDIVTIAIGAVISRADSFTEMEQYGLSREEWFREFLELEHGTPSHDTFNRVFALLSPNAWQACFLGWAQSLAFHAKGPIEVISVDGKSSRRSHAKGASALHTVSGRAHDQGVVLGSTQVPDKGNEITVIPELSETLDIRGAVVTLDAMGAQKHAAWTIREQDADYLLTLKANHLSLLDDAKWLFARQESEPGWVSTNAGRGRFEERTWWPMTDLSFFAPEGRGERSAAG